MLGKGRGLSGALWPSRRTDGAVETRHFSIGADYAVSDRLRLFDNLCYRLNYRTLEDARAYVTEWCRKHRIWSGSNSFRQVVTQALPDLRACPEGRRREAVAGVLVNAFQRYTGQPMVRSKRFEELRDHFRAHGRFPDYVHRPS